VVGEQSAEVHDDDVEVDVDRLGDDYGVPTAAGDDAVRWAARRGGWVLDRTYTGKGMSGLLARAAAGEWGRGDDVVFVHTGGHPAVFAPGGSVTP
jgi:1-aminocyclopropane-1-carboxylate deaminase/D-cysteine desulfhydrase-like pyridoxal-dependent ACC family enzyme